MTTKTKSKPKARKPKARKPSNEPSIQERLGISPSSVPDAVPPDASQEEGKGDDDDGDANGIDTDLEDAIEDDGPLQGPGDAQGPVEMGLVGMAVLYCLRGPDNKLRIFPATLVERNTRGWSLNYHRFNAPPRGQRSVPYSYAPKHGHWSPVGADVSDINTLMVQNPAV